MVRLPPLGRVFMCLYEREGFQRGGAGGYVDHILVGIAFLNVQWSNEFDPVFLFFFFVFFLMGEFINLSVQLRIFKTLNCYWFATINMTLTKRTHRVLAGLLFEFGYVTPPLFFFRLTFFRFLCTYQRHPAYRFLLVVPCSWSETYLGWPVPCLAPTGGGS